MQVTQWILELVDRITSPLHAATDAAEEATRVIDDTEEVVERLGETSGKTAGKLEGLGKGMFFLNQLKEGVDNIRDSFNDAIEPGIRFETAVAEMSGITNMEGKELDVLATKARNTAKAFGVDASNAMVVYKDLLSKITPELKKAPDALEIMSNNVMTLSKTMQNDVPGASAAMSTAMNQYKVSLDDPMKAAQTMTDYMNIMAAGTVEGSAEIREVAEALKQTGSVAKTFGVEFAETNSLIQLLDKSGKKGSEGGIALRNTIVKLQAPTTDAIKQLKAAGVNIKTMQNQSLSLTDRLRALTPVMHNATIMSALFGSENLASAMALIEGVDQIDTWTEAIQGSTSAVDMANKQMDTYAEKQKRMQAFIDDLKISFFELVEPIAPAIEVVGIFVGALVTLGTVAWSISQIMSLGITKIAGVWIASMAKMALSTIVGSRLISVAIMGIPVIGWIVAIITAVIAFVAFLYNKFEGVRVFLFGLWEVLKTGFLSFFKTIHTIQMGIIEILNPVNWFRDDWSINDVFERVKKEVFDNAVAVGRAWEEGKEKGRESWRNKDKVPGLDKFQLDTAPAAVNKPTAVTATGGTSGKDVGLGGKGGSSVRNITMNVTFNNHFRVAAGADMRDVADKVKREILAVITDTVPAIG